MVKINVDIAEILGLLCSDGYYRDYVTKYFGYDKRRGKSYWMKQRKRILEFHNSEKRLCFNLTEILHSNFDYKPNIKDSGHRDGVWRVSITKLGVIDDLISFTTFGGMGWRVPKVVQSSSPDIKASFLRGFFDGDGCVDFIKNKIPRVRLSSSNRVGLKQIRKLLSDIGIESTLNGPYERVNRLPMYEILISGRDVKTFVLRIGTNHTKKLERFNRICRGSCRDNSL